LKSRVPHTMSSLLSSHRSSRTLRDWVDVYFVGFIVRQATVRSSGIFQLSPEIGNIFRLIIWRRISLLATRAHIIMYIENNKRMDIGSYHGSMPTTKRKWGFAVGLVKNWNEVSIQKHSSTFKIQLQKNVADILSIILYYLCN